MQEGKIVSKGKVKEAWDMPSGADLELGNWEVQIDDTMAEQSFKAGFTKP